MINEVKAVIFDLEGVLCSTDRYQDKAWKMLADKLNKTPQIYNQTEKSLLLKEKEKLYRKALEEMTPSDLSEEVRKTLNELRLKGLKLAVGSSSAYTGFILHKIGLDQYFDAVSNDSPDHKKTIRQILLETAVMLNIAPSSCVTVQSTTAGAQAGHAADMTVICLGNAARADAGDYNLTNFSELKDIVE